MYSSVFSLLCVPWQLEAIDIKNFNLSVGVNTLNVSSLLASEHIHIQRKSDSYIHLLKCVFHHCQAAKKEKNQSISRGSTWPVAPCTCMPFHKITWRGWGTVTPDPVQYHWIKYENRLYSSHRLSAKPSGVFALCWGNQVLVILYICAFVLLT